MKKKVPVNYQPNNETDSTDSTKVVHHTNFFPLVWDAHTIFVYLPLISSFVAWVVFLLGSVTPVVLWQLPNPNVLKPPYFPHG